MVNGIREDALDNIGTLEVVILLVAAMPTARSISRKRQQGDEKDDLRPVMMMF